MPQKPIPTQMPLNTSAHGINNLSISQFNPNRQPNDQTSLIPLPENTWTFTDLVSAINLGLQILETPSAKAVLITLGTNMVGTWRAQRDPSFSGGSRQMAGYVDHFLAELRSDFPYVVIKDLGSPDVIASASRAPNRWNGNLSDYQPKRAVTMTFNHTRVNDMVQASAAADQLPKGDGKKKMLERHKKFQFMFAAATAHELCHAFVGYISGNGRFAPAYTPPSIDHLDYGKQQMALNARDGQQGGEASGESGRWFENRLFGGSLEFYRDTEDGSGQPGIAYILDTNEVARRVSSQAIFQLVESPRQFEFPLRTSGSPLSRRQRRDGGMQSIGSTVAGAAVYTPELLFMRAREESRLPLFNFSRVELDRVPSRPAIVRAMRGERVR